MSCAYVEKESLCDGATLETTTVREHESAGELPPTRRIMIDNQGDGRFVHHGSLHVCKHCQCVYWVPNE